MCRTTGAAAAGYEMGLSGCSEALQNQLESGGTQYPYCEWNCMGAKPPLPGETDRPGAAAQAQQRAAAGNSGIQSAVTESRLSGGA